MLLLGVNIATTRVVSEELAFNNFQSAKKAMKKCIIISLILGIAASSFFCLFADFIVKYCFHSKVSNIIVYLIAIALPIISFSASVSGYFTAVRRVYKPVIANFLEQIAKIIVTVFLLKIYLPTGKLENICYALILGDVISELFSFTFNVIALKLDVKKHLNGKKQRAKENFWYKILRILCPVAFTSYIRSGLSTVKQLIIPSSLEKNGLNCEVALAEYGTISGMAMPIIFFPSIFLGAVSGLFIPEFSSYYVRKEYSKIRKYSFWLIILAFAFSSILTILFLVFGNKLGILIYSDLAVGKYIQIFAPLIPFMYVDIIIDSILKGLDAQVNVMFINIVDLLVSISFIFFFVPALGIKGYILSVFVSEFINFILSMKKLIELEKSWRN